MKEIPCGDLMPGCDFKAAAETVAAHATEVHGLDVTPELIAQVKAKIRDR